MYSVVKYILLALLLFSSSEAATAQIFNWDEDATPTKRVPYIFPDELNESGYCCLKFDINPLGITNNIRFEYCTNYILKNASKNAVSKWLYEPATLNGDPVIRQNARVTLQFNLSDFQGLLIAGPAGYLSPKVPLENIPPPPDTNIEERQWAEKYFHTDSPCGEFIS